MSKIKSELIDMEMNLAIRQFKVIGKDGKPHLVYGMVPNFDEIDNPDITSSIIWNDE